MVQTQDKQYAKSAQIDHFWQRWAKGFVTHGFRGMKSEFRRLTLKCRL